MKSLIHAICAVSLLIICSTSAQAAQSRSCTPIEVGVFSNRIHVKCAAIKGKAYTKDIPYYAMALKNGSLQVQLTLELLVTAKAHKRNLTIWVDMADYKSVPGCLGSDCRRLIAVAIK
ncbi:MAG: hypothetical protein V7711_07350 [Pseudomonadales bacterium]